MRVAVAGGTGLVGRLVVDELTRAGATPIPIARDTGVDLLTGAGLEAALDGVEAVIDTTNAPSTTHEEAAGFFETATARLADAAARAGARRLVLLSIVGVDRIPDGTSPFADYYRAKFVQEQLAQAGPVPVTVLRSTQFHAFPAQLVDRADGDPIDIPQLLTATVDHAEVAGWLAELAGTPPQEHVVAVGGPEIAELPELAQRLLDDERHVRAVRAPGAVGDALATGLLIPDDPWRVGSVTFDQWRGGRATR